WSLPVAWFGSAVAGTAVVVIGVMAAGAYFNQPGFAGPPGSTASASPSESATPDATQPASTPTAEPTPTAEATATEAPTSNPTATLEPTAPPTSTPAPALYTWTRRSANEDWPAPLRVEGPGSDQLTSTSQYIDPQGDTTPDHVSAVD